jgi:hypothetical protein
MKGTSGNDLLIDLSLFNVRSWYLRWLAQRDIGTALALY